MLKYAIVAIATISIIFTSCTNNDNGDDLIPILYSEFTNASYSGQTDRLNQLSELVTYAKTANDGETVDASNMIAMFSNEGGNGGGNFTFSSEKQLENKTENSDYYKMIFAEFETSTNSDGQVLVSNSGAKQYFVNANGLEYAQIIDKGIMGACFMNQIQNVYLGFDKMNVDNNANIVDQDYTPMEHHWDEAFGYYGSDDNRFWAKYAAKMSSDATNGAYDCPTTILDAYVAGRYAIIQKDYTKRDQNIAIIREQLEYVAAGTAIHYLNAAASNYADDALRCHELSEAIEFINALQYVSTDVRKITPNQISSLKETIGNNLFEITLANINSAADELASIYGFESFASQL